MTYDESVSYLTSLGHETVAIKLGLDKIRLLLAKLGDPQNNFFKVQIAGTNGKGSTAAILDSICRTAGIRTALFTSPHLIEPTERIRIGGKDIEQNEFARWTAVVREASDELVSAGALSTPPTFFEHLTAMFLLAAAEAGVELAIVETGLGGRLDATTATNAEVVAITPIAMDHQEYLGHTLAGIAAEKAAIIRTGVAAISAPQLPEAANVIARYAAEHGVHLHWAADEIEVVGATTDGRLLVKLSGENEEFALGLRGRHQLTNAATAVSLAETLRAQGWPIDNPSIRRGLERAHHPGRLERWGGSRTIIFDGAHNAAGAEALADYLREFVPQPITLVFGVMREKDLAAIEAGLLPLAQTIILAQPESPRAADLTVLRASAPAAINRERIILAWDVPTALQTALEHTSDSGVVCVTGSLYLVGEAQKYLQSPEGADWWTTD
jgi:dihydrofolate synthase/folylpolyglutamate synthase